MTSSSLLGYLDRFYNRGAEIAYSQMDGYRSVRWSYRRVAERSYQFARELENRQIHKGERVCLWGRNSAEWVAAFLGCVARGAVVVPMDTIASSDFAQRVFKQVEGRLWVCSREQQSNASGGPTLLLEDLPEMLDSHDCSPYCSPGQCGEDVVQIVFTSGTTADPKGVIITHKNIVANLDPLDVEIQKYLKYERVFHPLRFLNLLPLSHVFGQFMGIFVPHLLGATVVFHESLNPSEIMRAIKRERVSVLVTVPRLMGSLRDKIERDCEMEGRLSQFREEFAAAEGEHFLKRWWRFRRVHGELGWKFWAFISGGAALDSETERFWGRLGFAVIQGYGLTETTSIISVNHPFKLGKGSIGKVLPGRELRLDDHGEILVRGDNVALGYYQGKESRPVLEEGWFHTGDMGELDPDGNLYFKGRKKNIIVTPEGMKIYPEDLEAVLRRQAGVRDCVVVGLDRDGNAESCAVLILNAGVSNADEAVKRANESLADYQRIRNWIVWPDDDFPRTSTQKPRINAIQEFAQSRLTGRSEGVSGSGTLADLITRITGRPISVLSPEANLASDLNLSSVDRVELLSALEGRFQLDLNETHFTSATTVADIEKMLHQPLPRRSDYEYPRWTQRAIVAALRLVVYYLLIWPATLVMSYPRIRGREHLRGIRGPVLFICNHITQVDVGFILAALPLRYRHRLAVAMWGELLRSMREPPPELGFLKRNLERFSYWLVVALFNVFPLPQQSGFRESFAFAGETADRGYSILVFPEGQRTRDGKLSPFRVGIGLLARNLALPVIPMKIDGLFELKRKNQKLSRPGSVTVTIGQPIRFEPVDSPEKITAELECLVASMQASHARSKHGNSEK
jgi:long-chain acyl-CoA synthetase